jgi:haloalkane dehalogenase
MGMGYSEIHEDVTINPNTQVDMLVSFLDRLGIRDVDLVANDSGAW